jgi:carbonic anhydrase
MDARIDPLVMLGFELGDVHVIRNAGAAVTDDVLALAASLDVQPGKRRARAA